mmetsp:Transcript_25308/g.36722  ORF Transcript_25308/g.36722 Transcript_25308/m.36722 type:complete len:722 (+) Transcript_25308:354-2519(+)
MKLLITPQLRNVATSRNISTVARRQLSSSSVAAWTTTNRKEDDMIASLACRRRHYRDNYHTKSLTTVAESHIPNTHLQAEGIFDSRNLLKFDTLHEMQKNASIAFANNDIFGTYVEGAHNSDGDNSGTFEWMTYKEYGEKVETCRTMLKNIGVQEYSKIGIIANNRWEWAALAAAAYSLNASLVPMYEAQLPKDWAYILNDSECMAVFCATKDIYDRTKREVLPNTPYVKEAFCLDGKLGEPYVFATAMDIASKQERVDIIPPSGEDLANLVYTSGTTGKPKGVELTHSNFASQVHAVRNMVEDAHDFVREADRSLAFLPWAHSYGQTAELWCAVAHGSSMGICRGVPHILEDLQMVKPSVLFAVPTLYKRVYGGVHNLMESSSPLRKKLMKKSLALGQRKYESENGGAPMGFLEKNMFNALDGIVLQKIRDRFGGRLRHAFVAGAACPKEIIEFMDSIGIPLCEGYGLTETSPIIAINTPFDRKPGCVGKPIGGVNVYLMGEDGKPVPSGQEGEICCTGPNVMRGYYKNPEATAEVISVAPDGKSRLFHTGDLGRMGEDGFVQVTGRVKEMYKLENGKYVCPTPIEEAIGMSRFINQVVLCGANRPYNVALLVPDWTAIRSELSIDDSAPEEDLVNDSHVKRLINGEIESLTARLKKFEVPQDWTFVAPFTAANNMLTPKMSIRRHMVVKTYENLIARMYGDDNMTTAATDGVNHDEKVA